jgi:hypothetical protein
MHLLEPVTDQLERFAKALLERGVQFFVDRPAHLFQFAALSACIAPSRASTASRNCSKRCSLLFVRSRQVLAKGLELLRLQLAELGHLGEASVCDRRPTDSDCSSRSPRAALAASCRPRASS